MGFERHGQQRFTADGELGKTGESKMVLAIHIDSGATAGVVTLRNGTAVTDTIHVRESGNANSGRTISFAPGFHFPAGCYVDVDANVTSVIVCYDEWAI